MAGRERTALIVQHQTAVGQAGILAHRQPHDFGRRRGFLQTHVSGAARAQLAAERVGPALVAGTWVVTDRSVYSSLAYQGGGRGLGIDKVRAVNEPGLLGVWPDLVIVLRIDPVAGLERQQIADRIGAEGVAFQQRVSDAFDTIASADPERVTTVDAAQAVDAVVADVLRAITDHWGTLT